MRRLFSSFARGWPGVGLLVLRVAGGTALGVRGLILLQDRSGLSDGAAAVTMAAGVLLIGGLWTPIAGILCAAAGFWFVWAHVEDPMGSLLLVAIGVSQALVGPGAWSIDARLFGWKRIDLREPTPSGRSTGPRPRVPDR